MHLKVYLFPSYIVPTLFTGVCPKLWQELRHRRSIHVDFVRWDGYLSTLPDDRAIIFSSYSNDLRPLELRQYCDDHGHLLVENELNRDVSGVIVGDTIIERFEDFLSSINPRMRRRELVEPLPSLVG